MLQAAKLGTIAANLRLHSGSMISLRLHGASMWWDAMTHGARERLRYDQGFAGKAGVGACVATPPGTTSQVSSLLVAAVDTLLAGMSALSGVIQNLAKPLRMSDLGGLGFRRSEVDDAERLEFALDATNTGLWTYDRDAETFDLDHRTKTLWGMQRDGAVSLAEFAATIHPDDRAKLETLIAPSAGSSELDLSQEIRISRFDTRKERWIALRGRQVAHGNSASTMGTARDVTEAHQHNEQVHLLMREVTHRSKNLLAIIQAMARQTVKDSLTAADFERRFSMRLRGLSFSHEILAARNWRGASLSELTRGHLGAVLESHGDRIKVEGPSLVIRPEAAQNIGLAFNELTSNAVKFGALSGESGTIAVEWLIESGADHQPRWLHVLWNEYGGAVVAPPLRQGFGHKVMERVVARALDGIVTMTFAPTGLQWSLRIPVSHILQEGPGDPA